MMPPTEPLEILLLEDDPSIAKTIVYALERAGFSVRHCLLVQDAFQQIDKKVPHLLVLDIGLPDGTGLDVCKRMRGHPKHQHIPILMLSAQGEEVDRIVGLELGADDYVTKPFSPRELVARIQALLRRACVGSSAISGQTASQQTAWMIDIGGQRASLKGQALTLTKREFGLLAELLQRPNKIHSRESLFNKVWGADSESSDRTVDTHIKTLRAKLEQITPDVEYIETHRGMGYSMSHLAENSIKIVG